MPPRKPIKTEGTVQSMRTGLNNVYYEKKITKNLGDYESASITVGVCLPIDPTEEELALVRTTMEKADELVTRELEIQLKELTDR